MPHNIEKLRFYESFHERKREIAFWIHMLALKVYGGWILLIKIRKKLLL